jgi:hypothetical protein
MSGAERAPAFLAFGVGVPGRRPLRLCGFCSLRRKPGRVIWDGDRA